MIFDKAGEEYCRRMLLLSKMSNDEHVQKLEMNMSARSAVHFCNNWLLTYDPRNHPKHFPFRLYDYQEQLFKWLDERYAQKENGLLEKSRDMGATWSVCAWAVHRFLFDRGFTARFGSRKEMLVDDKSLDSIFGKLRYLVYRLPSFLRPKINPRSDSDAYMRLVNPLNGNTLIGESMNENFGRGGRSSISFLDEFAFVPHSEAVWAAISDNSDCNVAMSTPHGKGNEFARLKHESPIKVFTMHWSQHPNKTQAWYEKKKLDMMPWQVAQELDLSYEQSLQGRVYTMFDRQYHVSKSVIECNPDLEQFITWDFGIADPTAMLFGQITGDGTIQIWGCFELTGWDIDFYKPIAKGFRPQEYALLSDQDKNKVDLILKKIPPGHLASYYGDHSGVARTVNSKRSCAAAFKEDGITLKTSGKQTYDWRYECLAALLKLRYNQTTKRWYNIFEVSPDCQRFIDCMFNYVWDGENLNKEGVQPKHDWASHMVSAAEFFAINRFPVRTQSGFREQTIR